MENKRYFQYLAGERKGEVVIFDHIEEDDGMVFICFKDDSRCNEELILPLNETVLNNHLMAEVSDYNNVWVFKEDWVGRQEEIKAQNASGETVVVQPYLPGRKKITPIPPRKVKSNFGNINKSVQVFQKVEEPKKNDDPVWLMMSKAKKIDTTINMEITISLPSKALYNVAKESFEDGDNKVIDYIINNIDNKKIKDSLKTALFLSYEDEIISSEDNSNNIKNE
jgi:hypothetical protein